MAATLRIQAAPLGAQTLHWRSLQEEAGAALSCGEVFTRWRDDAEFCGAWVQALRDVVFPAYCWECPPVSTRDLNQPFQCVFVASPLLEQTRADPQPFREHFEVGAQAVGFASLRQDSWLIAPCPQSAGVDCTHLARFTATASDQALVALWRAVGAALQTRITTSPLWLSTAGLGVSWLHVRLDSRPKYYRHAPYKLLRG